MTNRLYGKCTLSIKFDNHGEYLKYKKYMGIDDEHWDFIVSYPAIMRAEYEFHTVDDINAMVRKIVQLLQFGINVHSANWQLKDYKSQLR